jgi:2-haloacid dehalogenase
MRPTAVLFDAYGTLFDVHSVVRLADDLFPGQGERISLLWRDKQIEYTRLVSMSGPADAPDITGSRHYQPFWDLTRAALRFAAAKLLLPWSDHAEAQLMDQYLRLDPFPENRAVLQALRQRGVPTGILSNGNPDMLNAVVRHAGFDGLLDHVISVHPTRRYKTDPVTYALGATAMKLPAAQILFVSSNCWDAIGATWFGYATLWINRAGAPLDALGTAPTHQGRTLDDVLALT